MVKIKILKQVRYLGDFKDIGEIIEVDKVELYEEVLLNLKIIEVIEE